MSKLKEQTLFSATSIDNKDLFWISKYISGTEGSAGTYETFRITSGQLKTLLCKQYTETFTPVTVGNNNTITHNLNTRAVNVQLYNAVEPFSMIMADIIANTLDTIQITFNENPAGDVVVVILGV